MEKELVEFFEAAKKAADAAASESADGGAEESRCLDALQQLKNFPVTYQLLVSTQVGKRLRHLTKHPRKKIQSFASELMEIWKDIVIKETNRNRKNESLDVKDSVKVESVSAGTPKAEKDQKPFSVKVEKVSKAESIKVEKIDRNGTPSSEKVSMSVGVKRERKVQSVDVVKIEKTDSAEKVKFEQRTKEEKQAFGVKKQSLVPSAPKADINVSDEADEDVKEEVNACDPIRVAVSIESLLFEKWGGSLGAQKAKYRSLMFNLRDGNNPDFRRRVLLGHIKPERLINMNTAEMASDKRQNENKKIEEKALFDCERGGQPKATTDQFKCGRCGQRKCTYYQMQTRSADEPMTTYVTCVNCNNHWKFC
ncbi:transcription elongation factor tfiis [Quercus suber]|uniref:Transcription elongation factor n=1 Tax=Quercus suber TaxID=58331 RepID=A0AAW0KT48_QUESU